MLDRFRFLLLPLALIPQGALAQQGDGTDVAISTHVVKPALVEATPERIAALDLPEGFSIEPFAKELKNIRIIAVSEAGFIYVSRREQGDVILLKDADQDGQADGPPKVVATLAGTHGLAIKGNQLFIATVKEVYVADIDKDGSLGTPKRIIKDLPDSGQHPNRTIAFGPEGMLYISVGSTCNACNESSQESAALLRASPDGKKRSIFATGLRNTIGFDWHPETGELWGADHGIDFLGDTIQPEEVNRIELGKAYGWPHIWGTDGVNPQSTPVGGLDKETWKKMSTPMVLGLDAHAAPMQMVFANSDALGEESRNSAFITLRGSWNRKEASGYGIVRIKFKDGVPEKVEPFLTGFLSDGGRTHFARPVGLAMARDGALLMADDANGVIYRIAANEKQSSQRQPAPPTAMLKQASQGSGVALAIDRLEASTDDPIDVSSPAFADGADIPEKFSEYGEKASPPLSWSAVSGAKSYVLLLEDPDAKDPKPYVHWVAWNIAASVTALPPTLQKHPRLTEPEGVLQGRTSYGSVGYFGPRPPVGDPAHRYHFQVFALDKKLDVLPGANRDDVLAAMKGSVLAKGKLVGRFAQDAPSQ